MRPDRSGLIRVENERYALALYRAFTCQLVCVFRFGFSVLSIVFTPFSWRAVSRPPAWLLLRETGDIRLDDLFDLLGGVALRALIR